MPIVTLKGSQALANSEDVAYFFGKQHAHVLRDIMDPIEGAPVCASNFGATSVPVRMPHGGTRMDPAFDMTKDGFTGAEALQFKLA